MHTGLSPQQNTDIRDPAFSAAEYEANIPKPRISNSSQLSGQEILSSLELGLQVWLS